MTRTRIYCDYNATAPLRPEARAAMQAVMESCGNPSSVHAEGRAARARIEAARDQVAAALGACRDDIAFCSGGTEACQTPLLGALAADSALALVVSPIEHDCVAALDARHPGGADRWPVGADGVVDLSGLKEVVERCVQVGRRPLVSWMIANHETGVIQPGAQAAEIVRAAGGWLHCDAVQGLGKVAVSVTDLEVDYLSVSAHKVGGPLGVGAFYVKPGAPFRAVRAGGGQEFGRRSGTENVPGIAGFGAAAQGSVRDLGAYQMLARARDAMEARLKQACPSLVVHGAGAARLVGVSCFGLAGWSSETQIMALDLAGFGLSAGAACSSGKVRASRVLTAMGVNEDMARSSVRASFGWGSMQEEFDRLADAWIASARRARPALMPIAAPRPDPHEKETADG